MSCQTWVSRTGNIFTWRNHHHNGDDYIKELDRAVANERGGELGSCVSPCIMVIPTILIIGLSSSRLNGRGTEG